MTLVRAFFRTAVAFLLFASLTFVDSHQMAMALSATSLQAVSHSVRPSRHQRKQTCCLFVDVPPSFVMPKDWKLLGRKLLAPIIFLDGRTQKVWFDKVGGSPSMLHVQ